MLRATWLCGFLLVLSACANGYSQFYQPLNVGGVPVELEKGATPQIVASSGDPETDRAAMAADGFVPIGYASFNGPNQGIAGAIAQGKSVGAARIIVSAQYARTVSGAIPIAVPTTQTSYTSGNVQAYGSGGYAYGTYSGTTTSQGSTTSYMPYSVDRYDQTAIFFARVRREGLGISVMPLTADEARSLGSNKGLRITAVRRGSPAFDSDLLPGDILRSVNGSAVYDGQTLGAALVHDVPLALVVHRGNDDKTINVIVPSAGW